MKNGQAVIRFANEADPRYFTAEQPRNVSYQEYYTSGRTGQPELVQINRALQQPPVQVQVPPFQTVQIN